MVVQYCEFSSGSVSGDAESRVVPVGYLDTSLDGWVASILEAELCCTWSVHKQQELMTLLKLRAVTLDLQPFKIVLQGKRVAVLSDNAKAVSHLTH